MTVPGLPRIAVLDDYQQIARTMADWSPLDGRAEVVVFTDHLDDPEDVVARLAAFDAVSVMRERTPLTADMLERLPRLRLISSTGSRNAAIDGRAAERLGIEIRNTGYSSHGALELTWALLLALVRRLPTEIDNIRNGRWQTTIGGDLRGRTLGVLGLGNLGTGMARIGSAFGMQVLAWSEHLTQERAAAAGAELVDKDTLLAKSDVVTVHLVLSSRTRGLIGARELDLLRPDAFLVNTSRGPIIDQQALVDVLRRGAIAGAAVDVYDIEPLPVDHPFRTLNNLLATPHIGFVTRETYRTFFGDTVQNFVQWLDGRGSVEGRGSVDG